MNNSNKNIIWLASYPKSGNTWVRIFLKHIFGIEENEENIAASEEIPIASNRYLMDQYLGVPSSELTEQETIDFRPLVYREISNQSPEIRIMKVHDAFGFTSGGDPVYPQDITRIVIYIVRNPLDVVISYARHSNISIDKSVERINNPDFTISENISSLKAQVPQFIGSWSTHINSWLSQKLLPVYLIKYEDLLDNTRAVFIKLLRDLDIEFTDSKLEYALKKSSFKYLKNMEKKEGFKEKPIQAEAFFREGKSGYYKNHLDEDQIKAVCDKHHHLLIKFGYLKDYK